MIVPASSGLMGILPSHAPTVAQLRSGVVEVHDGDEKESYFVSSGFAFVHKDRTDVCAVEAVKVRPSILLPKRSAKASGAALCERRSNPHVEARWCAFGCGLVGRP